MWRRSLCSVWVAVCRWNSRRQLAEGVRMRPDDVAASGLIAGDNYGCSASVAPTAAPAVAVALAVASTAPDMAAGRSCASPAAKLMLVRGVRGCGTWLLRAKNTSAPV